MHINFSEQDTAYIKEQVANGNFVSEAEVVRDAIRGKRDAAQKHQRLREIVMESEAAIKRGEGVPLTKELLHQIMQQGIEKARNNEPYHSSEAIPDDAFDSTT